MLGREFASTKLRLQLSRFYHVFLVAPGISKCDMRGAIYKLLKGLAEASGSRTHRRQGDLPPAGFEDRDDHRTACASAPTLRPYLTGDMAARLAMLGATLGHAGARPATPLRLFLTGNLPAGWPMLGPPREHPGAHPPPERSAKNSHAEGAAAES